jgi:tRNA threonylcarbamoyladenosine biosynthesis protein TsaB
MNYLAIDTSGAHLTVLACKNDKVTVTYIKDCKLNHSVVLMDAIEDTLIKADLQLSDTDFLCACIGAGSFTGIRIGVATIKALSFSCNKKTLSVTAFDTLAYNIENGRVLAVIDAKHEHFYVCGYEDRKIVLKPEFVDKSRLIELSKNYKIISEKIDDFDFIKGDVVKGFIEVIKNKYDNLADREGLIPLYIRKSQAEENR